MQTSSDFSADDYAAMAQAITLARRGEYTTTPNPSVGCVVVQNGQVVGQGWHQKAGDPHAEVYALRQAGAKARGATAYVTLEPCSHYGRTPPCCDALIAAQVKRVVVAMQDPNPVVAGRGLQRMEAAGVFVASGLLGIEAEKINPGFISRMTRQRPYVRLKLAASLDGRTAMASGESQWITCPESRADVHRLRAHSCAIVTGLGTVLADNPSMNVRDKPSDYRGDLRQPIRVICDTHLQIPESAKMFALPGQTWVLCCVDKAEKKARLSAQGVRVAVLAEENNRLSLSALLDWLGQNEVNEILVESGATLAGSFLQQGLVDELTLYLAPHLMGNNAKGLVILPGLEKMQDRITLEIEDVRQIGADIRLRAKCFPK